MNYFKIILSLMLFSNILNASYLFSKHNICIEDYYFKKGVLYFNASLNDTWYVTSDTDTIAQIYSGYEYNSTDNKCIKGFALENEITIEQYNFLLAFIGILFGGIFMFFTTQIFINVGGKR